MTLIPPNKLRNEQNRRITKGLFNDLYYDERFNFFTLKRWDIKPNKGIPEGLVSFPLTYLKYAVQDPTEYFLANEVFGDWEHWQLVCNMPLLADTMEALRKERDIAIKSKAYRAIQEEALDTTSKNSYAAHKWLAEKGWDVKTEGAVNKRKAQAAQAEAEKETQEVIDLAKSLSEELGLRPN